MIFSCRVVPPFVLCAFVPTALFSAPFASNVQISGTNVSFILNEPADLLTYSINGGANVPLDGTAKGTKSFSLGAAADTFAIKVSKTDTIGYTIPTGGTVAAVATGLSVTTNASGLRQLSDDTINFSRYNSPRGVAVSNNPNAPAFGTVYLSNSAAGSAGGRTLGDGMYALHADQSDAFAYGDTAQDPGNKFDGIGPSTTSPFRVFVASNGQVYVSDFSDANGNVWRMNFNMTTDDQTLAAVGGLGIPTGQNHGSTMAAYVEGSSAGGNLVLYTLDEDLTTSGATGSGSTTDKNSLWRYDINAAALPFGGTPTKVSLTNPLVPGATSDLDRGADGKFYLSQLRSAGGEAGITVLDSSGAVAFDSLTASRELLSNPTAADIYRNVQAIAVSPDQKWLAVMLNDSDVSVIPLLGGIPDLANRLIVDTGTDVISGRDIAFDAAGNIHYVSSGQGLYRVLSPGGTTVATTSWDGTSYSFSIAVPEPTAMGLVVFGMLACLRIRKQRIR